MSNLPTTGYQHGYSEATLASHAARSATTDMSFLVPYVNSGMSILDVGCGPGSITLGFAELVGMTGKVVGVDAGEAPIAAAKSLAKEKGVENSEFMIGSVYSLPFPDETFDMVYCNQVLLHLRAQDGGAVAALKEMRRVCKKGGIVAPREAMMGTLRNYPETPGMIQGFQWLIKRMLKSGADSEEVGARLREIAEEAGYEREKLRFKVGLKRASWGAQWVKRASEPDFLGKAVEVGVENASKEEQDKISSGWKQWSETDGAWR